MLSYLAVGAEDNYVGAVVRSSGEAACRSCRSDTHRNLVEAGHRSRGKEVEARESGRV